MGSVLRLSAVVVTLSVLFPSLGHSQPVSGAQVRTIAPQPGIRFADLLQPDDSVLVVTPNDAGSTETEARDAASWIFAAVRASDACVRVTTHDVRQSVRADGTWIDAEVHAVVKDVLWARAGTKLAIGSPLSWSHTAGGRARIRHVEMTVGYPFPEQVPADYLVFAKRVSGRWTAMRTVIGIEPLRTSPGIDQEYTFDPWRSLRTEREDHHALEGLALEIVSQLIAGGVASEAQMSAPLDCRPPTHRIFDWDLPALDAFQQQVYVPPAEITTISLTCLFKWLERRALLERPESRRGLAIVFDDERAARHFVELEERRTVEHAFGGAGIPLPTPMLPIEQQRPQLAHARAQAVVNGAPSLEFSLLPLGGAWFGVGPTVSEVEATPSGAQHCRYTLEGRCLLKLGPLPPFLDLAREAGAAQVVRVRARLDRRGRLVDIRPDDGEVPGRRTRPLWDAILRHIHSWVFDPGADEQDVRLVFDVAAAAETSRDVFVHFYDLPDVQIWFESLDRP